MAADIADRRGRHFHHRRRSNARCAEQRSPESTATIIRTVDTGEDHEPQTYSTWSPKAIAQIGALHPTLTSRAIRIELQRKRPSHKLERLRADRLDFLVPFKRQMIRWAQDHRIKVGAIDPVMPDELGNRSGDNWRAMFAIADVAGGEWPKRARAVALGDKVPVQEIAVLLLEDILKAFEQGQR